MPGRPATTSTSPRWWDRCRARPCASSASTSSLNGLLASPTFAAWAEGPGIDLDRLLRAADGERPACAIVSLSHLSDDERQFVVSLLLGKLVTWMRRQPGTDQLRLLVHFDEVMGFVPPTAMPPAKKPILTLFKTARAFGVGTVLATQNPVDVDYKGLSNAGTWMIGRLQTEQDKARLLDGLSSAGGSVDIKAVRDTIGGLDKREFMMRERWLDSAAPWASQIGAAPSGTTLAPALVTRVALLFDDDKLGLRETEEWEAVVFPLGATVDPARVIAVDHDDRDLRTEPPRPDAAYVLTDAPLTKKTFFTGAEKAIVDHLYRTRTMQVLRNPELKLVARPGETPEQFAARCQAAAQEAADKDQVALQARYENRITKAREALGAAQDKVAQVRAAQNARRQSDIAAGAGTLLGAVLGGRRSARSLARDMSRVLGGKGRLQEAKQRVRSAENRALDRQEALAELEADLARDLAAIDQEWAAKAAAVDPTEVPLEKSDIRVTARSLVWVPVA